VRKLIAAVLAGWLCCSSAAASEPALLLPSTVGIPAKIPAQRPLAQQALREAIDTQQPAPEHKRWMERHPVWFGLIVGAGAGAALGAASCGDGCFPIGAGGAALVGSWYGAGLGALIGWGVGRAK
jgi:hypothetical protein